MRLSSPKALALAPIQLPKAKLQDHVYDQLCTLILNGEIEPGQLVTIQALSDAFGVSTMPVREALQKLTGAKALTVISGRSIGIPPLTAKRLLDLTRVRVELEGVTAEWAVDHVSKPVIGQLNELFKKMSDAEKNRDIKAYIRANREFHFTIYRLSGSDTAYSVIEGLWLQIAPYFHYLHELGSYTEANAQHRRILSALKAGDKLAVKQGIRTDIGMASRLLLSMLSKEDRLKQTGYQWDNMNSETQTVGIVGAGLIGCSWANVFARAGWQVRAWDPNPAQRGAAHARIAQSLRELQAHGLVSDAAAAAERVRIVATLEDAVHTADYVQESGPETVEAKRETFAALDAAAPAGCVLGSSTSAIVASKFTESLAGRARCIVAHPVNPPHLVPVVELCGAPWTSAETRARARAVMQQVGQVPVEVKREIDGFVVNRLQVALLTEAFRLVEDGVVSPQDLDHTIAEGLGLRWAFMGPFETIELNAPEGIADYCERYVPWFRRYMADLPAPRVWDDEQWRAAAAAWGPAPDARAVQQKSLWRNDRLAALVAHKRGQKPAQDS